MYYALIYILLFITGCMAFIEDYGKRWWNLLVYIAIGTCLIILAAFRPAGMDNDYEEYVNSFIHYADEGNEFTLEWSYRHIAELLHWFTNNPVSIFLFYAVIGIGVKLLALRRLTPMFFLPVCVYIGYYFILQDFTQIRAGAASAFMLLGLAYYADSRWRALVCFAISVFFHYSSVVLLPTLLLTNRRMQWGEKMIWPALILMSYVLYFTHFGILSLPIPYVQEKLEYYDMMTMVGFIDTVNVFNLLHILRITAFLYLLYFFDTVCLHIKAFPIIMRFWGLSICAFVSLTSLPILSFRISELLALVDIVVFPSVIYTIKPQWVPKLGIVILASFLLFMQAYINKILVVM